MNDLNSSSRVSYIPLFSQVVRENCQKILVLESQIHEAVKSHSNSSVEDDFFFETEIQELEWALAKHSFMAVVFSAIAVEAYIYDYAVRHLTDAFVQDHIDKLDTFSKWIIVPKLITGKELPRNRKWIGLLKRLIKTRNSIIHHKSSSVPPVFAGEAEATRYFKRLQSSDDTTLDAAKQAVQTLDLLIVEMTALDPEEEPWIKGYLG